MHTAHIAVFLCGHSVFCQILGVCKQRIYLNPKISSICKPWDWRWLHLFCKVTSPGKMFDLIVASGMSVLVMTHQCRLCDAQSSSESVCAYEGDLPHSRSVDEELHVDTHHAWPAPPPWSWDSCNITQACQTTIRAGFTKCTSCLVSVLRVVEEKDRHTYAQADLDWF